MQCRGSKTEWRLTMRHGSSRCHEKDRGEFLRSLGRAKKELGPFLSTL